MKFKDVVTGITPWRRWMLSQGQLLTEAGFLNLEGFFISLLQLTMKTEETVYC